jgi:drug/metabolite transporter (DMT)-like permease
VLSSAGLAISAIAIFSTLAYIMFFYAIKTAGPVFASQCAYVVTISGVLWGIVIFAEVHTVWVWLSVAVMMAGLALVTPGTRNHGELSPYSAGSL